MTQPLVKIEPVETKKRTGTRLKLKTCCPLHTMQRLLYRCAEEGCAQPYLCLHPDCIDAHFHSPTLRLTRIDLPAFEEKFERTQQAIANSEKFFSEAFQIKAVIDSLKNSVTVLFKDVSGMGRVFGDLKADLDSALSNTFIGKVEEALRIESRINASIEKIRAKINLTPEEQNSTLEQQPVELEQSELFAGLNQELPMKQEIVSFLEDNVPNFSWSTTVPVVNTREKPTTNEEFHKALVGKSNLVFLLVGDGMVVGSYFSCLYPPWGNVADPSSFIFIARQDPTPKLLKFEAHPEAAHHLSVSEQFLIAQGHLEGEGKGVVIPSPFQRVDVALPSSSFILKDTTEQPIQEVYRLLEVIVLQVAVPEQS